MLQLLKASTAGHDMDDDEVQPISENAEYVGASDLLARLQGEISAVDRQINALNARWYRETAEGAAAGAVDSLAAAEGLLKGGKLDSRTDLENLDELRRRRDVLSAGMRAQAAVVEKIKGQLSLEASRRVRDRHRDTLLRLLEATRDLVAAAAAERRIRGDLIELGYAPAESQLPAPRLAAALALGDENWIDSPISFFRRQLEKLGIA
jgi:hypothetical protein